MKDQLIAVQNYNLFSKKAHCVSCGSVKYVIKQSNKKQMLKGINIIIINKTRGKGKTTGLIYTSEATDYPIIVATRQMVTVVKDMATKMGCVIPEPRCVTDFINDCITGEATSDKVLVDELDACLKNCIGVDIVAATITADKNIGIKDTEE